MNELCASTPDRFPASDAPQDAVVTVSSGWTGGHGEAVLDAERRIRRVDDLPVFLADESHAAVFERADLRGTWSGSPVVRVAGRVRLERRRGRAPGIPGFGAKTPFVALVVEAIDAVLVVGER